MIFSSGSIWLFSYLAYAAFSPFTHVTVALINDYSVQFFLLTKPIRQVIFVETAKRLQGVPPYDDKQSHATTCHLNRAVTQIQSK